MLLIIDKDCGVRGRGLHTVPPEPGPVQVLYHSFILSIGFTLTLCVILELIRADRVVIGR